MNIEALKDATRHLRAAIAALQASDPAAARLALELDPLMTQAELGRIQEPVQWRDIPGNHLFTEQGLQQYVALESTFAKFCGELTGGETSALRRLKQRMAENGGGKA